MLENPCPLGKGLIIDSLRKSGQQYHNARPMDLWILEIGLRTTMAWLDPEDL